MLPIVDIHWHEPGFRSRDGYVQSDRERAWRSEGTEANNFKAVYGAWPWTGSFFKRPLKNESLQATISHRPIAFVPEGSSLDRCVTLKCGIRDE